MTTKDRISFWFAGIALLVGFILTILGFVVNPLGIIDNSVLWVLGQCLTFVGAVCGVSLHAQGLRQEMLDEIKKEKE